MSIGRHLYQRFKLSLACLSDWGISGGGVCCLGNVLSHSLQTLPPEIHTLRLSGGCCQWYTGIKCLLVWIKMNHISLPSPPSLRGSCVSWGDRDDIHRQLLYSSLTCVSLWFYKKQIVKNYKNDSLLTLPIPSVM